MPGRPSGPLVAPRTPVGRIVCALVGLVLIVGGVLFVIHGWRAMDAATSSLSADDPGPGPVIDLGGGGFAVIIGLGFLTSIGGASRGFSGSYLGGTTSGRRRRSGPYTADAATPTAFAAGMGFDGASGAGFDSGSTSGFDGGSGSSFDGGSGSSSDGGGFGGGGFDGGGSGGSASDGGASF